MKELFKPLLLAINLDGKFITNPNEIISELIKSKLNGNSVGIAAPLLGSGMHITGIADILLAGGDSIVVLEHYDANGYFLPINVIRLKHIRAIHPFISKFENPLFKRLVKAN